MPRQINRESNPALAVGVPTTELRLPACNAFHRIFSCQKQESERQLWGLSGLTLLLCDSCGLDRPGRDDAAAMGHAVLRGEHRCVIEVDRMHDAQVPDQPVQSLNQGTGAKVMVNHPRPQ